VKSIILLVIVGSLLLVTASSAWAAAKPLVVATIAPLAAIASEVGGAEVDVEYIVPVTSDPHQYVPTLEDAELAMQADLFLEIGKEPFLKSLPADRGRIKLTWRDWIDAGLYVEYENPHYIWLYPPNVVKVAQLIAEKLSLLDPQNKEFYIRNAEKFAGRVERLKEWGLRYVESHGVSGAPIVAVGSHFIPLLEFYGFKVIGPLLMGEGQMPNPSDTAQFAQEAKRSGAGIIVVLYSQRDADEGRIGRAIAEEIGAGIVYLHGAQFSGGDDYVEYIKYTMATLVGGLEAGTPRHAGESLLEAVVSILGILLVIETFMLVRWWRWR